MGKLSYLIITIGSIRIGWYLNTTNSLWWCLCALTVGYRLWGAQIMIPEALGTKSLLPLTPSFMSYLLRTRCQYWMSRRFLRSKTQISGKKILWGNVNDKKKLAGHSSYMLTNDHILETICHTHYTTWQYSPHKFSFSTSIPTQAAVIVQHTLHGHPRPLPLHKGRILRFQVLATGKVTVCNPLIHIWWGRD